MKKLMIAILGSGFLIFIFLTAYASQPAGQNGGSVSKHSLDSLLRSLKESRIQESAINKKREREFIQKKDARERLLQELKDKMKRTDKQANALLKQLDANDREIQGLKNTLKKHAGNLQELVAVVGQYSGDLSAIIQDSITSAQFSNRTEFLESLSQSKKIPSIEKLEKLWFAFQQEMTESGKVVKFPATIISPSGEAIEKTATRVGIFSAVAEGRFLKYEPETGALMDLPRQPPSQYTKLAENLENAVEGFVPMLIDPTRGSMLSLLVEKPDLTERIAQGGTVGGIIVFIGFIGLIITLFRLCSLSLIRRRIERQLKDINTPNPNNPLGRILGVAKNSHYPDVEALEMSLDEAILKEIPGLERGHAIIKLLAVIAPLLGLLGTVIGMIITFQAITLFGTGDPKLMADGISQALVTTALGLTVAIPLLFSHSIVAARAKSLIQMLDQESTGLIAERIEASRGKNIV